MGKILKSIVNLEDIIIAVLLRAETEISNLERILLIFSKLSVIFRITIIRYRRCTHFLPGNIWRAYV